MRFAKKWIVDACVTWQPVKQTQRKTDDAEAVDYSEKVLAVDLENADAKKYIA